MKKLIVAILLIAFVVGVIFYTKRETANQNTNSNTNNINTVSESTINQPSSTPTPQNFDPNLEYYTMEEVRKHGPESWDNGDSSPLCWMVIHDKVYEIPDSFTETHPGGHVIYEGCGTDATVFFETRPQGSGTPHSANARKMLEKFYIGELKK
jgi:cytochrome b involved in lipid metabolism